MCFYFIYRYLARSFTVILPYFPTGTMERVDTEGQVATAKVKGTVFNLLSSSMLLTNDNTLVYVDGGANVVYLFFYPNKLDI